MPVDLRDPRTTLTVIDAVERDLLQHCRWSCAYECFHAAANQASPTATFSDVLQRAISRRAVLAGAAASVTALAAGAVVRPLTTAAQVAGSPAAGPAVAGSPLTFTPITIPAPDVDELVVAEGYTAVPLLRWGDALFSDAPPFDPAAVTAAAQERWFGYNNDFVAFLPDGPVAPAGTVAGLLWVNHEYTNPELMFPGYGGDGYVPSADIVDAELAAHGGSVVEVARAADGSWSHALDGRNRRITGTTPFQLTGPAAGDPLLVTTADATGTSVAGTLNDCAGGVTPWGTILAGEENFNQYFANLAGVADERIAAWHDRYGLPDEATERQWELVHDRFDLMREPHEPFRFGWVVEIDPSDPTSTPKKRTALGRLKHEGATPGVATDGRVALYMGDDERVDYAYKFVTAGAYDPTAGVANGDLLDEGTLYVARFADDGTGEWLPLVHGEGPLTAANGFASQAEVLIGTRPAADLLEPTRMDRPEDIEVSPVTGKVYLVMTNNTNRGVGANYGIDAANPRAQNRYGHVIELTPDVGDHAATTFTWDIFLIAGDPTDQTTYFGGFDPASIVSPISSPDNVAMLNGNLWIATDGQPGTIDRNDAVFGVAVEGADRGDIKPFLATPLGAEAASLGFDVDGRSIFVSVQHPGEGGTFEAQVSRWPDFDPETPPRPSVVVAWRTAEGDRTIGA
jgi:secreted PhoX family phosphatase